MNVRIPLLPALGTAGLAMLLGFAGARLIDEPDRLPDPSELVVGDQLGGAEVIVSERWPARCASLDVIAGGVSDRPDMITLNETGADAGRYLYRTHEVGVDDTPSGSRGAALSVVDLETCETGVVARDPGWSHLDGLVWTPWGTALFGEEREGGQIHEFFPDPSNPMVGSVVTRPALGRMSHEGIEIGPEGEVYLVDESRGQTEGFGGGIYMFVPAAPGDLSSGELFALAVESDTTTGEGTGQGRWVGPVDPDTAPRSGSDAGATSYQRPEDLERIGSRLFAAITEGTAPDGDEHYEGRVLAIDLETLMVSDYVKPGLNVVVESSAEGTPGFRRPDNLAATPDGDLAIVEDNDNADIWIAAGDGPVAGTVTRVASLTEAETEPTGLYFAGETVFLNVQFPGRDEADLTLRFRWSG